MRLRLNNFSAAKATYQRVLRAYAEDKMPDQKARTMCYLFTGLLAYFRHEADLRLEERLDKIEAMLEEGRDESV